VITKLTLGHALHVARNMRENDRREVMATRWDDDVEGFAIDCFRAPGLAWVAVNKEDEPVVMGGVAINSPGVGTAWMVGSDKWLTVALEVSRFCKKSIKTIFEGDDVHRIQAFSAIFHTQSHKWLEIVGMQPNNLLSQWGKEGEDFILFDVFKGK